MKRKIGITLAILILIGAIILGIYKFSDKITEIAKVSQTDKPYALSGNTDAWNFVYKAYVEQVRKDENRTSGTLVDRKDRATAANGYLIERSDVGKQIDFSWYTLMTKRNTYCMQKGTDVTYGFPLLDYTVKYYANINENSEIDYSGTIGDVKNGTKERYLYALSYILADGKTCNHRDGKYLSYNSCYHQKAMWRLVYDWGGIGTDVKLDLNNSEDRKAYQLANEARAYGRYMYSRMNNGTNEFTTGKAYSINRESSDEDKNKINGYSILGVYRVYYPSTTFGEGTFKVSVGGIKEVTGINDKIYICNKNGEKIDPTQLKSGDEFYIACKQGEKGTITFKFNTVKAVKNAEIYYLSNSYNQDMLIGDATFEEKNVNKSISVQADKVEPTKGEYTININKVDSQDTATKLDGSVFGIYKVDTNGKETLEKIVWPNSSVSGSYNITIVESDYLESQANNGLKYRIKEMRAPSGYMKTSGYIELTLPIKINSNNKYEVDIPHINSTNFSLPNPAKVKYDTVKGTNITFDIPNIKYPEYEILLNKNYTDENGNPINATNELLQETVFKVEAYEKDGDNIINNNVIGSYNLSNDTNISKYITSMGKFTINIQDGKLKTNIILEKEDMYIRITEVNSPKEYTILEKPIEIGIKSQLNNGVYTITDVTTNDVKRVSYKDINNTKMTINVINEKITQEKPTELQITKYTYEEVEGSSTPIERKLDGVVFGIFNEKGEKLKEVTTNSDGIATYPIEYKNSIKDWNIKEYGKNSDSIKLIIKEIKEAEGYRKLSDDDQIEVEIKFGINETGNAIITNEIDVKYQMDAQGHIEINVYKKNDDGNYKIIGSNNYRTQIVNKELENVNGADWQNNQSNYDQTMFISEYEGKMRVNFKVPNYKEIKEGETSLKIKKVDSQTGEPLEGVVFGIFDKLGNGIYGNDDNNSTELNKPIATGTTNSDGIATLKIDLREEGNKSYYIKEISTLDNYKKLDDDEKIEVNLDIKEEFKAFGSHTYTYTYKVNNMEIINVLNSDKDIDVMLSNNNDDKITLKSVNYSPEDGENVKTSVELSEGFDNICIKVPNDKIVQEGKYYLQIEKVDDNDNTKKLKGAEFKLYNELQEEIGTYETDDDGTFTIEGDITENDYNNEWIKLYLKETKAPNGYELPEKGLDLDKDIEIILHISKNATNYYADSNATAINHLKNIKIKSGNVEVESPGELIISKLNNELDNGENNPFKLTIPNKEKGKYTIDLTKVDANDNNTTLGGAKFSLIDEDRDIIISNELETDGKGRVSISGEITKEDLARGKMNLYLMETQAPNDDYISLGSNEGIKLELTVGVENGVYCVTGLSIKNETSITLKVLNNNNQYESITNDGEFHNISYEKGASIDLTIPNNKKTNIDLALKKFIVGVTDNNGDYTETTGREPEYNTESLKTTTEATYTFNKDNAVEVSQGNIVRYTIRIYNEGSSDGYASLIKDYLPNGVELVSRSESDINSRYNWDENEDSNGRYISTRYLENTKIGKYEDGEKLDYKDVQVELKVTMPDMYIGTLKNVAEIAEMKNEGGTVITKDIDSSTEGTIITRDDNTITDYEPKEDDIDYDWIKLKDGITLKGRVWLDVPPPNTKAEINNLLDSHESFTEIENNGGVKVQLYRVIDKEGRLVEEKVVNPDGTYEFNNIKKSEDGKKYNKYVVVFEYNGIRFTNVEPNVGGYENIKINSKAKENSDDRETFNYKFRTINNKSGIIYTTTEDSTSKTKRSKFNYDSKTMGIKAITDIYDLGAMNNIEELQYINLGLKYRPSFDMALYKDVSYATVTVNGQQEKYTYDRYSSYNPETQTFDEFSYTVRQTDYDFGVRKIDTTEEAGLNIDVTYKIKILNQSSIWGNISKIVDYYDSHYKFIGAELRNNANETLDIPLTINTNEPAEIRGNGANYHSMNIEIPQRAETILGNNESLYIYITLRFKNPTEALNSLSDTSSLRTMNIAEIAEYSTYEKDTTDSRSPGLIDIDSAPGNFNIAEYNKEDYLEDDTGAAPALTYKDNNKSVRTLTGNVFEDIENADNINIKDIKVELIETNADGEPIVEDGGYRRLTYKVTTTDENGNYTFENFLPGYYIIRFSYGERKETVLINSNGGSNEHSYNGQDYESTEYNLTNYSDEYWYKTVTDKSDAQDVEPRRDEVNSYSIEYTNKIASVLNAWKANPVDEGKVQELIAKTGMYADTAKMKLSVEFGTEEINPNNVEKDDEGNIIYAVTGIDFGLKARPTNDIEIIKQISKINVLDSNNNTLISATRDTKNNVLWLDDSFVKAELSDELINGATIQVEYTISLVNRGNVTTKVMEIVDYVDNGLLFDSNSNEQWEVIEASNLKGDNGLVDNSINLANRNVILKAKAGTNPLLDKYMNPGQKLDNVSTVTLTKTLTTSNSTVDDLSYENMVEILKTSNDIGRKTESTPGNLNPEDPEFTELDDDIAERVAISNPTGQTRIYYVLGITVAIILIAGILGIKKFVIGRKD